MNLSDLQAECGRLLSDPFNTRWVPSTLTTRINIAQQVIQGYTNAIKTQESLTPIANTSAISINANTMDIIRVNKSSSNGSRPLIGKSLDEIDFLYPDWRQWDPGEPQFFIYDATDQLIYLIPAPDASNVSANSLTVFESRKPADLVNPTDIPFDSNNQMTPYHITICYWVVAQCWLDDGTPESLAKSRFHRSGNMLTPGEFEKNLGRIMSEFDVPEGVPSRVLWRPQGGRLGYAYYPAKSDPFLR